jgi:hypothetical protein
VSAGKLDELFRNWLALQETLQSPLEGDDEAREDEIARLTHEGIAIERAILAGSPETADILCGSYGSLRQL